MAKALLIAEKQSVCNTITSYIAKHGFKDDIDCIAVAGHVIGMMEPDQYKEEWHAPWRLNVLPMIPDEWIYQSIESKKNYLNNVKKYLTSKKYDYIICATDPEAEGQAIFYYVYNFLKCKLPVKRYWEKGSTDVEVGQALGNLRDEATDTYLINLTKRAYLRAYLDWLIGMNATRAASITMKGTAKIGRVKTPILKILVDIEKRIRDFKPSTSYGISLDINNQTDNINVRHVEKTIESNHNSRSEKATSSTLLKDEKFLNYNFEKKEDAEAFAKKLSDTVTVYSSDKKITKTPAPSLYNQTHLQGDASEELCYSVNETLDTTQSLYDKKITSYPRTQNVYISTEQAKKIPDMLRACCNIPELEQAANEVLSHPEWISAVQKNKNYVCDFTGDNMEGHDAISLTGMNFNFATLSDKEQAILLMIAKRLLSIFYEPKQTENICLIVNQDGNYFRKNIYNVIVPGWTKIYGETLKSADSINVKVGDILTIKGHNIEESTTTPPRRLTDGQLVGIMECPSRYLLDQGLKATITKSGIGTEATRAGIIEQLCSPRDGYVEVKGKRHMLYPTDKAIKLIDNLGDMQIASVDFTAKWEQKLADVVTGDLSYEVCYDEILELTKDCVRDFISGSFNSIDDNKKFEREMVGTCPACGGQVYEGAKAYYCENFNGDNTGCQVILNKSIKGGKVTKTNIKKILNGSVSDAIKLTMEKNGEKTKIERRFVFDKEQKKIVFYRQPINEIGKCPCCGDSLLQSEKYVYCKNYGKTENKCHLIFARNFCGVKLETSEILKMFDGEESEEHEFTSIKEGNKKEYSAKLKYDVSNNKLSFVFVNKFMDSMKTATTMGECPCCGGNVKGPLDGKFGNYYTCEDKCGLNISENQGGHKLTKVEIATLLNKEKLSKITMKSKNGKTYDASLFINLETKKIDREF